MAKSIPGATAPPAYRLGEAEVIIHPTGNDTFLADPVVQSSSGGAAIPPTSANFDGTNIGESSSDGVFTGAPSDTNGDVGPNHYVQSVNSVISIYSKDGTRVSGPTPIDDFWRARRTPPSSTARHRVGGSGGTNGTGDLDAGSGFTPDGTITLVVSDSKLTPAQGGPLAAGKSLTGFLSRIRLETQTGSALTPGNAPDSVAGTGEKS